MSSPIRKVDSSCKLCRSRNIRILLCASKSWLHLLLFPVCTYTYFPGSKCLVCLRNRPTGPKQQWNPLLSHQGIPGQLCGCPIDSNTIICQRDLDDGSTLIVTAQQNIFTRSTNCSWLLSMIKNKQETRFLKGAERRSSLNLV